MDILTQEEIDDLLDEVDNEEKDKGSPEFEKAVRDLCELNLEFVYCSGSNPRKIMENLNHSRDAYIRKIKEYKEFEIKYKKIQKIVREQPELFI